MSFNTASPTMKERYALAEKERKEAERLIMHRPTVYCVTRRDLPIIHQSVQAGHACLMAGKEFKTGDYEHSYLIYLHAENQDDMRDIMAKLLREGVKFVSFHEPDFDRGLTSFACEPIEMGMSETLCMLPLMEW